MPTLLTAGIMGVSLLAALPYEEIKIPVLLPIVLWLHRLAQEIREEL